MNRRWYHAIDVRAACSFIQQTQEPLPPPLFVCAFFLSGQQLNGGTIKLVGNATKVESEGKARLSVYVSPMLVPLGTALASVRGTGNVVVVASKNLSEFCFCFCFCFHSRIMCLVV